MQFDLAYTGMVDAGSIYRMDFARVRSLHQKMLERKNKEKEAMEQRAR